MWDKGDEIYSMKVQGGEWAFVIRISGRLPQSLNRKRPQIGEMMSTSKSIASGLGCSKDKVISLEREASELVRGWEGEAMAGGVRKEGKVVRSRAD